MGGPVQSSLHKLMNKPSKHRGRRAGSGTQQQSKLKRPSLLSRLSQSSSEQPVSPAATQQRQEAAANACSLPQTTEQHNDNSATTSWTCDEDSRTGLCPVCGLDLPVSLLQAHVEAELSLMINSNDSCMAPASADSNQMPPQKAHACPSARRDARTDRLRPTTSRQHPASQQKVMVLGGDVATASSHGGSVRRTRMCQVLAFDHYSDGAGTWDCDMVGVEGLSDPGSTWEGLGTISLGR
ncbi:hypothetical protein ABBQ38_012461 [Trebouxia sp. C0009 RCD-2024]